MLEIWKMILFVSHTETNSTIILVICGLNQLQLRASMFLEVIQFLNCISIEF